MNPSCARCGKVVYATEKINCLDKYWHRGCFHCEVCRMPLNMNNYKGYEKKPYCNSHYPKQTFTIVADTPENLRLRQQSELQSQVQQEVNPAAAITAVCPKNPTGLSTLLPGQQCQVKYRKDFEESKGRGFSFVLDTPELQRLRRTQDQISNAKYHKDFELSGIQGLPQGVSGHYLVRAQVRPNKQEGHTSHKGVHQYIMDMDRKPGIIVAPVLPGAYYPGGPAQGHSYMHQTSMHSLRRVQHRAHPTMSVYRALYDYTAQDTDEVSFRDGDIIQHIQSIDDGWMYGTVQRTGRSGMLPANYVEGIR